MMKVLIRSTTVALTVAIFSSITVAATSVTPPLETNSGISTAFSSTGSAPPLGINNDATSDHASVERETTLHSTISSNDTAAEEIAVVEKLYAIIKGELDGDSNTLYTPSFYALFVDAVNDFEQHYSEPCLDYDPFSDSQDPNIGPVHVSKEANGLIRASFSQSPGQMTHVYYSVKCDGGQCLIDNIINQNGQESYDVKSFIIEQCSIE